MKLREVRGNLLSSNATICHCVSADMKMSRGIAKSIKERFGKVKELRNSGAKAGEIVVVQIGPRFVYNLVTKRNYWEKPTYKSLRRSLEKMKEHAELNHVRKICMPRLGCGLDRLDWTLVRQLINDVFQETHMEIVVFFLKTK